MRKLCKHVLIDKLSEDRREAMLRDIGIASPVLDLLKEVIERRLKQLDGDLTNPHVYELPAYAEFVADHFGGKRELEAILKLLDHSED